MKLNVAKLGSKQVETEVLQGESVLDVLNRLNIKVDKTDQVRLNNKSVSTTDPITETGTLVISQRVAGA